MTHIKRYEVVEDHLNGGTLEYACPEGRWVKFEDHSAALEQAQRTLKFVERAANHHAQHPKISEREALSMIQHYPSIVQITKSYADGVIPDTRNPWAELEQAQSRIAELEAQLIQWNEFQKIRASQTKQLEKQMLTAQTPAELSSNTLQLPDHIADADKMVSAQPIEPFAHPNPVHHCADTNTEYLRDVCDLAAAMRVKIDEWVSAAQKGKMLPEPVFSQSQSAQPEQEQAPVADKLAFYVDAKTLRGFMQTYNTDEGVITWRTGDCVHESDVPLYTKPATQGEQL